MTIRTRLTLWYAGILFVSVLFIAGLSYHELVTERARHAARGDQDDDDDDEMRDVVKIILWCGGPAAIVGIIGGWFLMRKALAPVTALTLATSRITDRNLRDSLPRTGNGDELDKLTEVFNAMTARLDDGFQRIREFTLHASHELKTPLTVMRGELEIVLASENISREQRDHILSQLDEIERLTKIVDGLSLLTKADAGQVELKKELVALDELVKDAFEDAKILAQPQEISVCLAPCETLSVMGDRHRLRQLLLNLTDNAVKYNHPKGEVILSLSKHENFAEIKISNSGHGIAANALPRVFDRFFRGDESHNSAIEGCGLGLSIAQWIVEAHQGKIEMLSTPERQTTVCVRFPLTRM